MTKTPFFHRWCAFAALIIALTGGASLSLAQDSPREVVLYAIPGKMRFDIDYFEAKPGEQIALTLINPDDLQHNILVLTPQADAGMKIAQDAWLMPDAQEKQFIPDIPAVLASSNLLGPDEEQTITFTVPQEAGDYPFICSFPGHWMSMRGTMQVTREERGLRDVRYSYYNGLIKSMPNFSEMTPDVEGVAPGGRLIDMAPFRGDGDFSLQFKGTLVVPRDGEYTFEQQSDGGSRVLIDDKVVIERGMKSGDAAATVVSKKIKLTAGEHALVYDYFDFDKEEQVVLAWSGPELPKTFLSRQREIEVSQPMVLEVGETPRVDRLVLPQAPPKSMAVGLPGELNYVLDTERARVLYAWSGRYLDVAPDRVHRGGKEVKVLGEPQRADIGLAGAPAGLVFRGYRRKGDAPPEFLYALPDQTFTIQVSPAEGGLLVSYQFSKEKWPQGLHAPGKQVKTSKETYEVFLPLSPAASTPPAEADTAAEAQN